MSTTTGSAHLEKRAFRAAKLYITAAKFRPVGRSHLFMNGYDNMTEEQTATKHERPRTRKVIEALLKERQDMLVLLWELSKKDLSTKVIYTNDGVAQETIRKRSPSPAVSSRPLTSIDNTVKEKTSCSRKEGSSSGA